MFAKEGHKLLGNRNLLTKKRPAVTDDEQVALLVVLSWR